MLFHGLSKLTDSDGEQAETQHWIATSFACNYISQEVHDALMKQCCEIGKMLGSMMSKPEKFCRSPD